MPCSCDSTWLLLVLVLEVRSESEAHRHESASLQQQLDGLLQERARGRSAASAELTQARAQRGLPGCKLGILCVCG